LSITPTSSQKAIFQGALERHFDMRTVIHSNKAPKAVGPYSQAINANNLIFTSGQLPIDPDSGSLFKGGIIEQTKQVMENLKLILVTAGTDFSKVVKTTIYLKNIDDFSKVNEVYGRYFSDAPPARSTFQVAGLPLGAMIEIDMIAMVE